MRNPKSNTDREFAIWERVLIPDLRRITADQARYLLQESFPQSDLDRINELSIRADDGTLTNEEQQELERYIHVGHVLSIVKGMLRGELKSNSDAERQS